MKFVVNVSKFMRVLPFPIKVRMRALSLFIAALGASAVCPAPGHSCEVIVVKSADLKPYQDVLRGFKHATSCTVREAALNDGKLLQDDPPDAVFAIGTSAFKAVKAIKGLPLVYAMVMPSETSGANSTLSGVSMDISPETYVTAIKEVFPSAKRIGLLYDPRNTRTFVGEAARAASAAGIELVVSEVRAPAEIPALLNALQGKIDVFWMIPDPTLVTSEFVDVLLRFSFEKTVPVFTFSGKYAEMGAVAALEVDPYDMGAQAGEIVNRLTATRSDAIRVYARSSHLVLNMKVANKMGIRIRDEVSRKGKRIE